MTSRKAAKIHDAEATPWLGEMKPGPTPEQTKLFQACAALLKAQKAMAKHDGAYSGPEWAAKTQAYRDAWDAFEAVFDEIRGDAK